MRPHDSASDGPIVTLNKFGTNIGVGLVDVNRTLLQGFAITKPRPIYFRTLRHGRFGVMVLADRPVDVRVIKDVEMLTERRLDPISQPNRRQSEPSDVRRQVRDLVSAPQPFYITTDDEGSALCFTVDPAGRTDEELLALQLGSVWPEPGASARMRLAESDPALTASGALDQQEQWDQSEAADAEAAILNDDPPRNWAPSYGLVAVGLRLSRDYSEGESLPPDFYDYVLFQLNDWEGHARVRANLHNRVVLPKPDQDDRGPFLGLDLGHDSRSR